MNKEVVRLILDAQIEGFDKVQKQLASLSKKFNLETVDAIQEIGKVSDMVTKGLVQGGKKAQKALGQNIYAASVEGVGKSFDMGTRVLVSGLKDARGALEGTISGFLRGFGDTSREMSKNIEQAGERWQKALAKKGKLGQVAGAGVGLSAKVLAPLVGLVGTIASSVSTLVSLLFDAESTAKDLNKAILEGGVAGGDLASGFSGATDALNVMREYAQHFSNNLKWGTVAREQMEIVGAFNEAGFTIREMTKDVTDASRAMKDYANATQVALTYAKLLGMSTTEMATQSAEYMESLGGSISYVEQQFSAVYKTAQLSGFGVKRFYGMVQQATSGMSLYNVRLDEAAGLLLHLGKILGSKVAGDFLAQLSKGFVDESMVDRYKRVMITGVQETQDIMYKEALNTAQAFGQNLATQTKTVQDNVATVLGVKGIEEIQSGKFVDKLAKMSEKDKAGMIAEVRALDEGLARELEKLATISAAQLGGVTNTAEAMDALGPGGALAMQLQTAMTRFGKPLHELKKGQLAGFESMTGISGEQRMILTNISRGLYGQFDVLQQMAASPAMLEEKLGMLSDDNKMSLDTLRELEKSAADNKDPAKQLAATQKLASMQKEMQEKYGAFINGQGAIVRAQFDSSGNVVHGTEKVMSDVQDFVLGNAEKLTAATQMAMDENTALAQEIAANTTDMAKILEIGVGYWLEKIYQYMGPLVNSVLGLPDYKEIAATTSGIMDKISGYQEEALRLQQDLAKKDVQIKTEKDPEKKKVLQAEKEAIEESIKQNKVLLGGQQAYLNQVQKASLDSEAWANVKVGDKTAVTEMVSEAYSPEKSAELQKSVQTAIADWQRRTGADSADTKKVEEEIYRMLYKSLGEGRSLDTILKDISSGYGMFSDVSLSHHTTAKDRPPEESLSLPSVLRWGKGSGGGSLLEDFASFGGFGLTGLVASGLGLFGSSEVKRPVVTEVAGQPVLSGNAEDVLRGQLGAKKLLPELENAAGGREAFQRASEEELRVLASTLGLTEQLVQDMQVVSNQGLTEKGYLAMSEPQKRALEGIARTLPTAMVRKRENTALAKEMAEAQAKQDILAKLREIYGGDAIPENLVDTIFSKGYAEGTPLVAEKYRGAYDKLTSGVLPAGTPGALSAGGLPSGDDFLWRPGSDPLLFNSRDTVLGAKPGGPLDKLLSGSLEGGNRDLPVVRDLLPEKSSLERSTEKKRKGAETASSQKAVVINIYGSQAEVYQTVKRVLSETGTI